MIYILILNWNGWRDTIECLESVFQSDYPDFKVIVCDNASEDDSVERIKLWAEGQEDACISSDNPLKKLCDSPAAKPIPYVEYDRTAAEQGGKPEDSNARMVLIHTGGNLGFAGGNNVGLRYALSRGDFAYVWMLNNDSVVTPDALSRMLNRMSEKPEAGICGSTVLYYDKPDLIQALGGATYNKWFGIIKSIGLLQPRDKHIDVGEVESKIDFVTGASMLVSKDFITDIGLMSEDYFLYCEELDWALRCGGKYSFAYAPDCVVYHKEGRSIGSSWKGEEKSFTADYYGIRSRLLVTRKHSPYALPSVYAGLLVTLFNRVRRGQCNRILPLLRLLVNIRSLRKCLPEKN